MAESITKQIVKHYGVLSETDKGWTKELNLVSWNGRDPKFDIREWAPDKNKSGKGVTIRQNELVTLKQLLSGIDLPDETVLPIVQEENSEMVG